MSYGAPRAGAAVRVPVLIGLPGSGKSSIARALGRRLCLSVFASDPFFRECRALPSSASDPRREVTSRFLSAAAARFPERIAAIRADADGVDEEGRCRLHDGRSFRKRHGEEAFREYEIQMLAWAHERGVLADKIVDLSASAPLYEENRRLFSAENGYVAILLDALQDAMCRNLIRDYETVVAARAAGNAVATIRGAYEQLFDDVLDVRPPPGNPERLRRLADAAAAVVAKEEARRMPTYRAFAALVIRPSAATTVEETADEILSFVGAAGGGRGTANETGAAR